MTDAPDYLRELNSALRSNPTPEIDIPDRPLWEMQGDDDRPSLLDVVKACLTVPNGMTRKGAAYALGQIGDPDAIPALEKRLLEESTKGNQEAIEAALKVLREMPLSTGSSEEERRKGLENAYFGRPLKSEVTSPYAATPNPQKSGCSVVVAVFLVGLLLIVFGV